jgi:hypothetical protein
MESSSRFSARYPARNSTIKTLANSPGWMVKPAMRIHSLEPEIVVPIKIGSISRMMPIMPKVYL